MYKQILVATGGSPWSDAAVTYAIAIASWTSARLQILTVLANPSVSATPDFMGGEEVVIDIIERDGQELLARVAQQADQAGVVCHTQMRWGNVPEIILRAADETSSDLIVLGARRVGGWKRLRLGHTANAVSAKARQPVLVVKQPPPATPGSPLGSRLLVATGGSPWSDLAVDYAITLAQAEHLSLCLLYVVPRRRWRRDVAPDVDGHQLLERAETRAAEADVPATTLLAQGDVAQTIIDTASQQQCDGIVLGSRGRTGWKRLMLGSISNAVAVKSELPVLIVKRFLEGY